MGAEVITVDGRTFPIGDNQTMYFPEREVDGIAYSSATVEDFTSWWRKQVTLVEADPLAVNQVVARTITGKYVKGTVSVVAIAKHTGRS